MDNEYKMSKRAFNNILATRKETEKKGNPKDYVIKVINEQYGLMGKVVNVLIYDE